MRSINEINDMIEILKEQRKQLPEYSAFGDNNHRTIDLQIETLQHPDRWDNEDEVYEYFNDEEDAYPIVAAWHWATGKDIYRDEIV